MNGFTKTYVFNNRTKSYKDFPVLFNYIIE